MHTEILYRNAYSLLRLEIERREEVRAEAGAMVSMSESVKIETAARGGFLGGLKRAVLGGESFCEFTGPGRLYLQTRSFQSFVNCLIPLLPKHK